MEYAKLINLSTFLDFPSNFPGLFSIILVCTMEETAKKRGTNDVSLRLNENPRDLLQRFNSVNSVTRKFEETTHEKEEDLELSLGLSMNGQFGVDPKRETSLSRSSSISNLTTIDDNNRVIMPQVVPYAPLIRTCSLPAEPGEEWRKRKELQTLRRMEAKRKRLEKLKNVRTFRDQVNSEENGGENVRAKTQCSVIINGNCEFSSPFQKRNWVSVAVGGAVSADGNESKGEREKGVEGLPPQSSSQGSIGSQGTGSSGISESESQPVQGMNKYTEVKSPASVPSLCEQKSVVAPGESEKLGSPDGAVVENPSVKVTNTDKGTSEMVSRAMLDMPCVSTRGDGPNGKRIEGFLYRYSKGEEVSIVCVCHGIFLSPAEFVKHAGGGDVAHPLRHIVVSPPSLL
ncbi:ninja-family protein AFP3-like [Cornus florida]|uniref:ninja-family protein AFP3-like n=1 Tax=Cornus florida TaxID=4283 RepID=UPI00289C165C|nr:ninja-family protein AFP3-like [Cornus florida]